MTDSKLLIVGITAVAAFLIGYLALPTLSTATSSPTPTAIVASVSPSPTAPAQSSEQVVSIKALSSGYYDKQEITVKAGIPVRFEFSA